MKKDGTRNDLFAKRNNCQKALDIAREAEIDHSNGISTNTILSDIV